MKIIIGITMESGEKAIFSTNLNLREGETMNENTTESDLTFGFQGDEKIGCDVRSLVADMISDKYHRTRR